MHINTISDCFSKYFSEFIILFISLYNISWNQRISLKVKISVNPIQFFFIITDRTKIRICQLCTSERDYT